MSVISQAREKLKELEKVKNYYVDKSFTDDGKTNKDRKNLQNKIKRIDKLKEKTEGKIKSTYSSRNKAVLNAISKLGIGSLPKSALKRVQSRAIIKEQKLRVNIPERKVESFFDNNSNFFNDGWVDDDERDGQILRTKSIFFS